MISNKQESPKGKHRLGRGASGLFKHSTPPGPPSWEWPRRAVDDLRPGDWGDREDGSFVLGTRAGDKSSNGCFPPPKGGYSSEKSGAGTKSWSNKIDC